MRSSTVLSELSGINSPHPFGPEQTDPEQKSVDDVAETLLRARTAQRGWSQVPLPERLKIVRVLRHLLAANSAHFHNLISSSLARSEPDTLSAEVLPLAEAARFLENESIAILQSRSLRTRSRPFFLSKVSIIERHEPLGVVLIIGPANYPLFLPGVQALQALTAGNAVILKPGSEGRPVALFLAQLALQAGLPEGLFVVVEEDVELACRLIDEGVDKIVLTGSVQSGRAVLARAAEKLTPAIVELSGCDAMFVLPGADLEKAARALVFGLTFNGSATCIAPRRVFVLRSQQALFLEKLPESLREAMPVPVPQKSAALIQELIREAQAQGATLIQNNGVSATSMQPAILVNTSSAMKAACTDVFGPLCSVISFDSEAEAITQAEACPYALGATVFGPERQAREFAASIPAGVVVVNDMIVPTADPRLTFGGKGKSGFGKTRGTEGLLQMTFLKSVLVQRGKRLRHLEPQHPRARQLFRSYLAVVHGKGLRDRVVAIRNLARAILGK